MRWFLLVLSLSQLVIAAAAAGAEEQVREVTIADPYIELHTGPGRGYPVFFVAERGEQIALLKRRTEWFKVEVARGQEGWVHFDQLTRTLDLDGEPFDLPALGFNDYAARRWEVGALYGDFGGANVIATYGSRSFTPNLSGELWISQALGRFSDSTMATLNIVHLMYPDWRASPYFTLGAGIINTEPKATLVATTDRTDNVALVGAGARVYLTRRFVFRAEYKAHVVFTSRDDNEEVREWKAGFSFFF
jgi:uncharacterized protein YgiM (DUF1202 family)